VRTKFGICTDLGYPSKWSGSLYMLIEPHPRGCKGPLVSHQSGHQVDLGFLQGGESNGIFINTKTYLWSHSFHSCLPCLLLVVLCAFKFAFT
jgi:hypothetical protein